MPESKKKKRPGVRIYRPVHIKRLLNRCINQVLKSEMDTDKLRAISYASSIILKVFEISELEKRLMAIEGKINA